MKSFYCNTDQKFIAHEIFFIETDQKWKALLQQLNNFPPMNRFCLLLHIFAGWHLLSASQTNQKLQNFQMTKFCLLLHPFAGWLFAAKQTKNGKTYKLANDKALSPFELLRRFHLPCQSNQPKTADANFLLLGFASWNEIWSRSQQEEFLLFSSCKINCNSYICHLSCVLVSHSLWCG